MFIEISLLSKAETAARVRAGVGSLICVDPQVVKEVVPLSEVLSAIVVIALQDFDKTFGLRILESEDPKFLSGRNVLFYLNRSQIEGRTSLDQHSHIRRDVLEGITVLDVADLERVLAIFGSKFLIVVTEISAYFIMTFLQQLLRTWR